MKKVTWRTPLAGLAWIALAASASAQVVNVDEDDFATVLLHEECKCRRHADIAGANNAHALNTQNAIPVII